MLVLFVAACTPPFPSQVKDGIPADHVVNIKGAMHKEGYKFPFRPTSGCSSNTCHHDDLNGGVAMVNGEIRIAPSCFQCHGTRWEEE